MSSFHTEAPSSAQARPRGRRRQQLRAAPHAERHGDDLLSFKQVDLEYGHALPEPTLRNWFRLNKYGFRAICIRLGTRIVVRRRDLETYLDSRKGVLIN